MTSEVTKLRRNFARSHFKEPTEKQIMKQWTKNQLILGLQKSIVEAPITTPSERNARCREMELLAKMTGALQPEQVTSQSNNVIFVTRAENKEAWQQQALEQQNELRRKTKVASDTGIDTRDSN